MLFEKAGRPQRKTDLLVPPPGAGRLLIRVHADAVCRTVLRVVDGELTQPKLPLIPGDEMCPVAIIHESVGNEARL
jgi:alcohol dehydrogenase, propanol-preferring